MNKTLLYARHEAPGVAATAVRFYAGSLALPVIVPVAVAGIAALSAAALGAWIADTTGRAILSELRRRARLRAPRPPSPSLRGTPTPQALAVDAALSPRTLTIRLRLGSRLADLAPTLDRANRYDISPTGAKRISGRGRGMRGWLEDNRVQVNYSTLMRYMRLAVRLRALLALDERLPLEWLLPGATPAQTIPPTLQTQYATSKRKLTRLLHSHWNFSRLQTHVDDSHGIHRLPRPGHAKTKPLDDTLAENTKHELSAFLQTRDLPPRLEALRREAIAGFL